MRVAVPVTDPAHRLVDLLEVGSEVGDEVGRLVWPDRAAALAQVQRKEVVAPIHPEVGCEGLEEVVGETVQSEVEGLGVVGLSENIRVAGALFLALP